VSLGSCTPLMKLQRFEQSLSVYALISMSDWHKYFRQWERKREQKCTNYQENKPTTCQSTLQGFLVRMYHRHSFLDFPVTSQKYRSLACGPTPHTQEASWLAELSSHAHKSLTSNSIMDQLNSIQTLTSFSSHLYILSHYDSF
jgi:hypothetical protein